MKVGPKLLPSPRARRPGKGNKACFPCPRGGVVWARNMGISPLMLGFKGWSRASTGWLVTPLSLRFRCLDMRALRCVNSYGMEVHVPQNLGWANLASVFSRSHFLESPHKYLKPQGETSQGQAWGTPSWWAFWVAET